LRKLRIKERKKSNSSSSQGMRQFSTISGKTEARRLALTRRDSTRNSKVLPNTSLKLKVESLRLPNSDTESIASFHSIQRDMGPHYGEEIPEVDENWVRLNRK